METGREGEGVVTDVEEVREWGGKMGEREGEGRRNREGERKEGRNEK